MLDKWIIGSANRISPEAPVPVLLEEEQEIKLGGAANLAVNIASLNGDIGVYGSIASDKEGHSIVKLFEAYNKIKFHISFDSKATTVKTRLVGQRGQHILRWDRDYNYEGNEAFDRLYNDIDSNDIVCISDYAKGAIRHYTIPKLLEKNCKVLVDPKQSPEFYRNAFLVKPNMQEYESWFGKFKKETALLKLKEYGWTHLVITDGANGIHLISSDLRYKHFAEPVQEVADVTGAGDTVLAVIAYHLESNKDIVSAVSSACYAASRAVEHRGVHIVTKQDIQKDVVFTNGVFDILHAGHLKLLKYAKGKGNKLIVGINSDASVRRLKGKDRPINDIKARIAQLEELPWVDEVHVFTEDTPYNLIQKIKPTLIVKGGDYSPNNVVGADIAEVDIYPRYDEYSTTQIVEKINDL